MTVCLRRDLTQWVCYRPDASPLSCSQSCSQRSTQLAPHGHTACSICHSKGTLVNQWNIDPRQAAQQPLQALGEVKRRISRAIEVATQHRRTALSRHLDQRRPPDPRQGATHIGHRRQNEYLHQAEPGCPVTEHDNELSSQAIQSMYSAYAVRDRTLAATLCPLHIHRR
jgi:hypothetical protein